MRTGQFLCYWHFASRVWQRGERGKCVRAGKRGVLLVVLEENLGYDHAGTERRLQRGK
jgi:hypothetical protein